MPTEPPSAANALMRIALCRTTRTACQCALKPINPYTAESACSDAPSYDEGALCVFYYRDKRSA